jgi:hypothetical protein
MAVYKNVASQKLAVFAYDSTDGSPVTGDAANITAQISKDGGTTAATNDVNPTELDATDAPGIYIFDLTQAETNADLIVVSAVSSTADVELDPIIIYTTPGSNAAITANTTQWNGTAVGSATVRADVINVSGVAVNTGTAQLGVNVVNAGGTAWGSGAITAGAIASNAITDAKIASNAITSAKIAANAIGASQIAANAITDAKINTGAITSAKFAAGAIDAAAIATDAIGADEIAAGAVTKIVTAVWDELTSTIRVIGSYGERIAGNLNAQVSTRASQASVDDVPTNAEFNARTLPSADYATSALLTTVAGYLDTEIAAILEDTGTTIPAQITALNNISTTQVLAQCTAALETAITELSGVPSATPTTKQALMLLYMALRNRTTTTASAQTIQNDAGSTIATATLSDDGTTMTKGEFA